MKDEFCYLCKKPFESESVIYLPRTSSQSIDSRPFSGLEMLWVRKYHFSCWKETVGDVYKHRDNIPSILGFLRKGPSDAEVITFKTSLAISVLGFIAGSILTVGGYLTISNFSIPNIILGSIALFFGFLLFLSAIPAAASIILNFFQIFRKYSPK